MSVKRRGFSYDDYCSEKIQKIVEQTIKKVCISKDKIQINMDIDGENLNINISLPITDLETQSIPINLNNIGNKFIPNFKIIIETFNNEIYFILPIHTIIVDRTIKEYPTYQIFYDSL